jgi:hypothetical protein
MKKALVLAMTLVASVSFGATMTLNVDGAAWDGSDVLDTASLSVVIEVSGAAGGPSDYGISLSNATGASVATGDVQWLIAPSAWSETAEGQGFAVSSYSGTLNSFGSAQTGVVMQIDFKPAAVGTLDIVTTGGTLPGGNPADITGVNIVPEPMTMALLGLGGMLIRRKK